MLKTSEKLKIIRWRKGINQKDFYRNLAPQQTASRLEEKCDKSDHWSKITDKIISENKQWLFDLKANEIAKLLRLRVKDSIKQAAEKGNISEQFVLQMERGAVFPGKLLEIYGQ